MLKLVSLCALGRRAKPGAGTNNGGFACRNPLDGDEEQDEEGGEDEEALCSTCLVMKVLIASPAVVVR